MNVFFPSCTTCRNVFFLLIRSRHSGFSGKRSIGNVSGIQRNRMQRERRCPCVSNENMSVPLGGKRNPDAVPRLISMRKLCYLFEHVQLCMRNMLTVFKGAESGSLDGWSREGGGRGEDTQLEKRIRSFHRRGAFVRRG